MENRVEKLSEVKMEEIAKELNQIDWSALQKKPESKWIASSEKGIQMKGIALGGACAVVRCLLEGDRKYRKFVYLQSIPLRFDNGNDYPYEPIKISVASSYDEGNYTVSICNNNNTESLMGVVKELQKQREI